MIARQKCSIEICSAIARRTVKRVRYCEPCAANIEQAQYLAALSADVIGAVRFRKTLREAPIVESSRSQIEPQPASGWKSRR
jgi:hypothetical protein